MRTLDKTIVNIAWFIVLAIWPSALFASSASRPLVCVVSYWHGPQNQTILNNAIELAKKMGYSDADQRIKFFGYPTQLTGTSSVYQALKDCLEGPYEEVILIAHKFEGPSGDSLAYVENEGAKATGFINDMFFRNVKWAPSLRQFTLVTCDAESTVRSYKNLIRELRSRSIQLRLAPTNPLIDFEGKILGLPKRLRWILETSNLIAEAAQDPWSQRTFCYLYPELTDEQNFEGTSCLRNYFYVDRRQSKDEGSEGASWLYLRWPDMPKRSHSLKAIYANPGNRSIVHYIDNEPVGQEHELELTKGSFFEQLLPYQPNFQIPVRVFIR